MTAYPARGRASSSECEKQCSSGWAWNYITGLYRGEQAPTVPPGGPQFISLGFLVVIPAACAIIFLLLTSFQNQPASFHGSFLMGGAVFFAITHGIFMLRVSLGYLYAQHDLVRYLVALTAVLLSVSVFGFLRIGISALLVIPLAGSLAAFVMYCLGRSAGFTSYVDLMRAKRLYLLERRAKTGGTA